MTQIKSGIRAALNTPLIYQTLQNLLGAKKARQNFVKNYLKPTPDMKILDIGCGTGDLLDFVTDVQYWGYDTDENYIAYANAKYGHRAHFTCKEFTSSADLNLPKFDVVLMIGVLHHIDDKTLSVMLKGVAASLKKNARLICVDPCFEQGQSRLAYWLISKDRGQCVRTQEGYANIVRGAFAQVSSEVKHTKWIPYTRCFIVATNI
jgi:2-polyprenyl-3-methyl-5-hydroxy-6-metoxy-1,4-benzoquinol methylase